MRMRDLIDGYIMLYQTDLITVQIKKGQSRVMTATAFKRAFILNVMFYQYAEIFHTAVTLNGIPHRVTEGNLPPIVEKMYNNPLRDEVQAELLKCMTCSLPAIRSVLDGNRIANREETAPKTLILLGHYYTGTELTYFIKGNGPYVQASSWQAILKN